MCVIITKKLPFGAMDEERDLKETYISSIGKIHGRQNEKNT